MKLLLTSGGVSNGSIRAALERLTGRPVEESAAVVVNTAIYAYESGGWYGWEQLRELAGLGWRRFGVVELTAVPSLLDEHWLPMLTAADVLLVGGGNTPYLAHWMRESGLAARLPALLDGPDAPVYVGISAGSMVVTHSLQVDRDRLARDGVYADELYGDVAPPGAGTDRTLGLTDFVLRPHLGAPYFPGVTIELLEAAGLGVPTYALDDQSAIAVVDGQVEVVSEGEWRLFEPGRSEG